MYLRAAVSFFLLILVWAMSVYGAYSLGLAKGYDYWESELKECAEEVSNGCPNVTTYAILLEEENARLNKLCKKSKP